MQHQRQVIREAVVAGLIAAGTAASTRVHEEAYDLLDTFPCLSVDDESEAQELITFHSEPAMERSYRFIVTAQVVQNTNASRARDQLLADVEACLASIALPGVKSIKPLSYQPAQRDEGQQRIRIGHQLFEAIYVTSQGDPSTAL